MSLQQFLELADVSLNCC